ncbi:hypothetical protein ACW4YW_04670 [Methylobacillus pratensis]
MKLDQEDKEFFQRRTRKETPHGRLAFILASIIIAGSLYVLYENKQTKPSMQPTLMIAQSEPSRSALPQTQPRHYESQTYQSAPRQYEQEAIEIKPEPIYVPKSSRTTVFKCIQPDGSILYSGTLCNPEAATQVVNVAENVIDSSSLRNNATQNRAMSLHSGTPSTRVDEVRYMSEVDVWKRVKELEMDLQSITATPEKMSAARTEINVLKNRRVRELSYDDENERAGLRRLLNSQNSVTRREALNKLNYLYRRYG